jgi:hypothetical protein
VLAESMKPNGDQFSSPILQAMLKRTLGRTSELEQLIKRYNPNKSSQVTAKQQHQVLGDIYKEIPEQGSPFRSPEMVAHVTRALQTLEVSLVGIGALGELPLLGRRILGNLQSANTRLSQPGCSTV